MSNKKLYKSRTDKKLDGVCAGIGEYFDIDPTVIRLGWVILSFVTALVTGFIAYIICAAVLPRKPDNIIDAP